MAARAKHPKKPKNSRTEKISSHGIEDVCLKADYSGRIKKILTVMYICTLLKIPDNNVHLYRTFSVLDSQQISLNYPKCPSAILHHLLFAVLKLNLW